MTKSFCDRCGKEIKKSYYVVAVDNDFPGMELSDAPRLLGSTLCSSCLKELKEWLKGDK